MFSVFVVSLGKDDQGMSLFLGTFLASGEFSGGELKKFKFLNLPCQPSFCKFLGIIIIGAFIKYRVFFS